MRAIFRLCGNESQPGLPTTTVVKKLDMPLIACLKCEIYVTNEMFFNLSWYSIYGLYGEGTLERELFPALRYKKGYAS